jgi:hypothetical protein
MSGTGAVCCDIGAVVSLDLPSAALDSSQIAGGFTADALSCRNQKPSFGICEAANGRAVARGVILRCYLSYGHNPTNWTRRGSFRLAGGASRHVMATEMLEERQVTGRHELRGPLRRELGQSIP